MRLNKTHTAKILAAFLGCALATPVSAQTLVPRLAVPDPGQLVTPPSLQRPEILSPPSVRQDLELPEPSANRLHFHSVRIIGARMVSEAAIASLFDPLEDRDITTAALKPVLDQANALYDRAGFPLGRALVPAQRIKGGVLVVRVVEGFVEKIVVSADNDRTRALVERMAAPLTRARPLTRAALERAILLIQDIRGLTLASQFAAMNPETGGTTLILKAGIQWALVNLAVDNRANVANLPSLPYVVGSFNNLLGWGDQVSLTALLSPRQKDFAFYGLALSRLVGDDGMVASLDSQWAQTLDAVSLRPFEVRNRSERLAANLLYPFLRGATENLNLLGGLYYSDAVYNLVNFGALAHDKNLVLQLGVDYARTFSPQLIANGGFRLVQGLAGFTGEPHTRLHTVPGFTKLRGALRLTWQPLDNLSVILAAMGQYSPGSLIVSETVAFGGPAYGRGFDTATISGSNGLGVTLQPEYRIVLGGGWSITPYPLLDYARTYNRTVDLVPSGELISAGVGARLTQGGLGSLTMELAKPLDAVAAARRDVEWRGYVGLNIGVEGALAFIEGNL